MAAWKIAVCAALAAAALVGQHAFAQTDSSVLPWQTRGPYIGLGVGADWLDANRFRGPGTNSTASYDRPGLVGIFSLGYALGNGVRLELEPGYRWHHLHSINGISAAGKAETASLMANAIYDFNIHTPWVPLIPHLGVGAGVARIWNHSSPHNGFLIDGHDTVPAFQGIAGVEYAVQPNIKIGLDYRYFVAHDADFRTAGTGLTSRAGDFNSQTALLTFRYEFAPPKPAPIPAVVSPPVPQAAPAPPPPPQPQSFELYFNLNSAQLTPEARTIVQQAAASAREGNITHIAVTGHTDTTGTASYNQRLSERRAEAVKAELVRDGVPADEIVTRGVGEQQLAVPTADRVNEPRNRRVVIELQPPGV